jgi:putative PIG3 family NAD(P)H quinone oxidoreductase
MANDIPATMTAIEITEPGGPEVLQPASRAVPTPEPGEVLIKVAAAGVNRPDVMQRKGAYAPPPGASDIPGLELAGEIAGLGDGATGFALGDAVCALVAGGGYAEYCVAPAGQTLPVPAGLSMVEAAAIPETFFTVWTNVFDRARLTSGESVLVHGGSSGIGTTAIQLARALGATVYATAGSAEKCAACERLGAVRAINYPDEDFADVIAAETGGAGVDVILDMVGGEYFQRNIDCLAFEGRLDIIAFLGGPKAEINFIPFIQKRLSFVGSTLRPQALAAKSAIAASLRSHVWPLLESGEIAPVIDTTYPLAEAAKAHARMESSQHIGKLMLSVGQAHAERLNRAV